MRDKCACGIAAIAAFCLVPVFADDGPTFIPDKTFKGSSLTGWHVLGQADWKAQNGEVIGTVKPGGNGGWLVLDSPYQDVGFFANFRCTGGCRTGIMFRAEKTAEGLKGIYVSLNEEDVAAYRVTMSLDGQELHREPLRPPPAAGRGGRGGRGPEGRNVDGIQLDAGATLPFGPPKPGLRPGEWNELEIFLDAQIQAFLNDVGLRDVAGSVAEEEAGRYGPLALYVGGAGEVRFKDIAYKDLQTRVAPAERVSSRFRMQRLNEFYYAWSAAVADFNHDGILDVVAGPYIYFGPDYTKYREIYAAHANSPSREYANECMQQFAADFTGDGWPDVLCSNLGSPIFLYVNPKGEARHWDKFQVVRQVRCEIMEVKDIDGDGIPEVIYTADDYIRYAKPDPANPTGPWIEHNISEKGYATLHGIGTGDINGDGRVDVVNCFGWWENPGPGGKEPWTYHSQTFGRWARSGPGGALMAVYDVNGDGLNDVVASLGGHDFGLAWYEQKRDAAGKISFVEHIIMKDYSTAKTNAGGVTFSQIHGLAFADIDGDGVPDIIAGKRYWSHLDNYHDPDPYGPPVLYWYRTVRNPKAPGGAEFVPELIHNRSGAGSEIVTADLKGDGAVDIITATDRGVFIFWGKPRAGTAKPAATSASK
ncbi:MAG: FG-GAP-like repeat-containing protein [Bryobacteraceae bacterium]|jgi:hypothetical protein